MEIKEKTQGSVLLNRKMMNWELFAQPCCLTVLVVLLLTVFLISIVKSGDTERRKLKNFYCIMQVCKNGDYQMLEMPMAKKDLALSLAEQYIVESNKYNNIYNLNNIIVLLKTVAVKKKSCINILSSIVVEQFCKNEGTGKSRHRES